MSINDMILTFVKCSLCGAAFGKCDCWAKCKCGWFVEKGKECVNPKCGGTGELRAIAEGRLP